MHHRKRHMSAILLVAAIALPVASIGCAEHTGYYRAHDPYHNDYHNWGPDEDVYYRQWYGANYHDQYRDYRKLNKEEQKRYWDWRHSDAGRDRDHSHDRDHDHDQH